mmetsp:Transcript_6606/g.9648  ORF Transcript_6606/g.9648 Transcript_6606/m.9648 type:complete len:336 (+) Transcript_6606:92-1099(+)|eukprot:CAMPEP_0195525404 /NCGR_PEP_ID=MMETSP0794_2-20130614/25857_1 /TAXON_ID=515487 /ORGANISM="Stephanopyxis turris, Strain CCMP 815" /LENGTH=335 /DNA_ID=CAMNT_0040655863 /DNA_START=87 /DNA_END=1094 /DNA_ORIENTATION=+
MAAVFEAEERVKVAHIEGLAALKMVKHCQESLPQMVTGSLLGLSVGHGILEITHAFPFPEPASRKSDIVKSEEETNAAAAEMDGHEYQLEMMKMLREVNVDNNCVGWYQSMYLGSYSTQTLVENQLSYQTDLSPNAVVVLYDPVQTSHGRLTLKCLRLTDECVKVKRSGKNVYIDPENIFEEIPVKLTNAGLVQALLLDVGKRTSNSTEDGIVGEKDIDGLECTFDNLDLSTNPYLEKHLEFLCSWVDDLAAEQHKFQYFSRSLSKGGKHRKEKTPEEVKAAEEGWEGTNAPNRMESLLVSNQIRNYCEQVDRFAGGGFGKLFLASGLQKEEKTS